MRITPPSLALASLLLIVSSVGHGQDMASPNPKAQAMVAAGDAALATPGDAVEAADAYETALAVDPADRAALLGLARASMKLERPGEAIHYYRLVLAQNPNDLTALEEQGEAMVEKGAFIKANDNLAQIKALCVTNCPEQVALGNAIAHATTEPALTAAQIGSKPVVTTGAN